MDDGGALPGYGRRGVDEAISRAPFGHVGQPFGEAGEGHFGAVRGVVLAALVPLAERTLLVGVDEPSGGIARTFGFDGKVGGKSGLAAAALLGSDDDCFHENHHS